MKKRNLIIIGLLTFLFLPYNVKAVNVTISINCNPVTVGQTTTCKISGTSNGEVSAVEGNFSISGGASIESANRDAIWGNGDFDKNTFSLYTDVNKSGTFAIGTLTIRGNAAGMATLSVTNVKAADKDFNVSSSGSKSQQISIIAPPTTTTTTARPTTTRTTTTRKVNTTAPTTKAPVIDVITQEVSTTTAIPLLLTSVVVGDFDVTYDNGKYYVTVDYNTEAVDVMATANEGITIIGTGRRTLTQGKNVVELILRNTTNQSSTVQVIITRPEDTNDYDTTLRSIKVVDYDLEFNRNTKEYTITIPSSVKEIYVIAESDNVDVIITGAGLQTLKAGNNDIYIKSSYGDLSTTEYVIHVKRSYQTIIMWVAIGILGAGIIGGAIYLYMSKRKIKEAATAEKNKIIAETNRTLAANQDTISVNGQNVLGVGRNTVVPTKVVDIKQPTNPAAVATSQPQEVKTIPMSSASPQPQVKVVTRTVVPQQVQTDASKNYNDEEIIVTDINQ